MDTTAGSRALVGATMQDAHVVQRLRQAGCVIIGKLSLSQFSWGRDWASLPCGWNSIVGQATSPFVGERIIVNGKYQMFIYDHVQITFYPSTKTEILADLHRALA